MPPGGRPRKNELPVLGEGIPDFTDPATQLEHVSDLSASSEKLLTVPLVYACVTMIDGASGDCYCVDLLHETFDQQDRTNAQHWRRFVIDTGLPGGDDRQESMAYAIYEAGSNNIRPRPPWHKALSALRGSLTDTDKRPNLPPLSGVIITHSDQDHYGNAQWLINRLCSLKGTRIPRYNFLKPVDVMLSPMWAWCAEIISVDQGKMEPYKVDQLEEEIQDEPDDYIERVRNERKALKALRSKKKSLPRASEKYALDRFCYLDFEISPDGCQGIITVKHYDKYTVPMSIKKTWTSIPDLARQARYVVCYRFNIVAKHEIQPEQALMRISKQTIKADDRFKKKTYMYDTSPQCVNAVKNDSGETYGPTNPHPELRKKLEDLRDSANNLLVEVILVPDTVKLRTARVRSEAQSNNTDQRTISGYWLRHQFPLSECIKVPSLAAQTAHNDEELVKDPSFEYFPDQQNDHQNGGSIEFEGIKPPSDSNHSLAFSLSKPQSFAFNHDTSQSTSDQLIELRKKRDEYIIGTRRWKRQEELKRIRSKIRGEGSIAVEDIPSHAEQTDPSQRGIDEINPSSHDANNDDGSDSDFDIESIYGLDDSIRRDLELYGDDPAIFRPAYRIIGFEDETVPLRALIERSGSWSHSVISCAGAEYVRDFAHYILQYKVSGAAQKPWTGDSDLEANDETVNTIERKLKMPKIKCGSWAQYANKASIIANFVYSRLVATPDQTSSADISGENNQAETEQSEFRMIFTGDSFEAGPGERNYMPLSKITEEWVKRDIGKREAWGDNAMIPDGNLLTWLTRQRLLVSRKIDVLKVPHHGSRTTSNQRLFHLVSASVYLISGSISPHNHPDPETLLAILSSIANEDGPAVAPKYFCSRKYPMSIKAPISSRKRPRLIFMTWGCGLNDAEIDNVMAERQKQRKKRQEKKKKGDEKIAEELDDDPDGAGQLKDNEPADPQNPQKPKSEELVASQYIRQHCEYTAVLQSELPNSPHIFAANCRIFSQAKKGSATRLIFGRDKYRPNDVRVEWHADDWREVRPGNGGGEKEKASLAVLNRYKANPEEDPVAYPMLGQDNSWEEPA